MSGFTVEAILTRAASLADGGLTVGFHTKELNADEKAKIMDFHNKNGWLLFSPNKLKDEDIPKADAEYETKTPSQRLRAVLYILWQQNDGRIDDDRIDFEQFYRDRMEKLINQVKDKLV